MFLADIETEKGLLRKIDGKSVLIIGGASTISSSFIKALLTFRFA